MDKNTRFSSFGKWVAPINMKLFNEQVEKYHLDKYTKKLKTLSFTKLFLYAHLNQMESLHDLNTALADKGLQKELGFKSISVSQLSRKNKSMDPEFLSTIFLELVRLIHLKTDKRKGMNPIKIIDSSTMPLNLTRCQWAHFGSQKLVLSFISV